MVRLLTILLLFSFGLNAQSKFIIDKGDCNDIGTGNLVTRFHVQYRIGCGITCVPTFEDTITDQDGWYIAFPLGVQLNDCEHMVLAKKAREHADPGYMALYTSQNGGISWNESYLTYSGDTILAPAFSFQYLPSQDRLLFAWQSDTYTDLIFSHSDDHGETLAEPDTILFTSGWVGSPSPIKMVVMPSGKVRCYYYLAKGDSAIVTDIASTDNGLTWSPSGDTIFIHGGGVPATDWSGNETGVAITDPTSELDDSTKMIAITRPVGKPGYMVFMSADGGVTWTSDATEDAGAGGPYSRLIFYPPGNTGAGNQPVDIIVRDSVYVLLGYRGSSSYDLGYYAASYAGAFENNHFNWSDFRIIMNAAQNDVHFGYPVGMKDWAGKLWIDYYNVSDKTNSGPSTYRVYIGRIKLKD